MRSFHHLSLRPRRSTAVKVTEVQEVDVWNVRKNQRNDWFGHANRCGDGKEW